MSCSSWDLTGSTMDDCTREATAYDAWQFVSVITEYLRLICRAIKITFSPLSVHSLCFYLNHTGLRCSLWTEKLKSAVVLATIKSVMSQQEFAIIRRRQKPLLWHHWLGCGHEVQRAWPFEGCLEAVFFVDSALMFNSVYMLCGSA